MARFTAPPSQTATIMAALFRLQTNGTGLLVLHDFGWGAGGDGSQPLPGVTGRGGVLYGTTDGGGQWGFGTVYRQIIAPVLTISRSEQGYHLTVSGCPGLSCRLEASTNLVDWTPLADLLLSNGTAEFDDADDPGEPIRFYRAVLQ